MPATTIAPAEAQRRIAAGAVLIDIRDPDEYARPRLRRYQCGPRQTRNGLLGLGWQHGGDGGGW